MNQQSISHRKASCYVHFVDEANRPITNKTIKVVQTSHEFLFGCGAFIPLAYVGAKEEEQKACLYEQVKHWLALFNYGTLPFYWGRFEPEEGKPQTSSLMNAATFLKEHQVTLKGHPLCWHTVCADWLLKYDTETIFKKQIERIHREVSEFKGTIDLWDVINEVVIMPVFDKYDNAVTRICKMKGQVGLVKEVFKAAKEANPNATLLLNDFNTSVDYEMLLEACLDAGVPIDAIGIQSHQHQGYWGADKVNDVLERFSRFKLPIHFTENTLISGDLMPAYIEDLNDWQVETWPTTKEGEARQAKEIEEMYRILYENKYVQAITAWDFQDGAWLGAPSGIIRKDGSLKPAYESLRRLIKEEWQTNLFVHTDESGEALIKGFKGNYLIMFEDKKGNITLSEKCDHQTIQLIP